MIGANERPESVLSSALSLTQRRPDTLEHLEFEDHSEVPYIYMNVLGKGQKGTVEKVKHAHTDSVYARKIYKVPPRSRRKRATEEIEFKNEVAITRRLARHRHVVRVVASYSTSDTLAVILEPAADSGDLKTFLAQYSTVVDPRQQASMLTTIQHAYGCLASGLAFMHAHRIRHRDIKPENILIHSGAVFYADFGISRDYSGRADSATEGMPGAFTARYCAPEVQDQGRRTWKSDVFSLGVVFLLLYTAVCNNEIVELAKTRRFYMYVEAILEEIEQWTVDEEVLRCLREMLKEEEAERLSAGQVLSILKENSAKYLCMGCQQEQDESCSHSPSLVEFEDELVPGTATLQTCVETEAVTSFVASDASTTSLFGRNTATAIALIPTNVEPDFSLSHSNQDQNVDPAPLRKVSQSPQPARRDSVFSDPYDLKVSLATISDSQTSTTSWDNTLPVSSLEPPAISQTTYLRTSRVSHSLYRHEMRRTTKQIELSDKECNLYQDCTYDLAVKPLGLGFRLSRRTPYGSILPSLRIYPIVEYFDTEMSLIQDGTLLDVQQAFATGRIHPFVQTEYGDNLLALALRSFRLDIARHLHTIGLTSTPWHTGHTAFLLILETYKHSYQRASLEDTISILRFILTTLDQQPDFTSPLWHRSAKSFAWPSEMSQWLCTSGVEYGLDRAAVEELCCRVALRTAQPQVQARGSGNKDKADKALRQFLTPGIIRRIKRHGITLLPDLFIHSDTIGDYLAPLPSFEDTLALGTLWLTVLASYDVHIGAYLNHENGALPGSKLLPSLPHQHDRKVVIGLTEHDEFVLGCRLMKGSCPGFMLVEEFDGLAKEPESWQWPYAEWIEEDLNAAMDAWRKQRMRFQRRMQKKESNRRSKKSRSRRENAVVLPGSWID